MIYYINVNKKRIVGRNNQISTRPLNLEYDVTEVIDFQFIDDNNQLQPLSPNTPGLTLAIGLKQNMPSYDLLALSHDYEIVNGQTLRFTVNTYTVNWLKKINKPNTEVFIEISQQSLESKKVWMRDYCYVWPRVWTAGLSPEEIQSKDYWTASETQEYVDNAIEGISGFVTEEQLEEGLATKQNTIDAENKLDYDLLSGTPTIPTKTSDLDNDSDFVTSGYVDDGLATKQDAITVDNKLDYSLLSSTPTIPVVPTNVSDFTNDAGYQTAQDVQDAISGKQDVIDLNNKLDYALISGAPTVPTSTSQLTNDSNFIDQATFDAALSGVDTDVEAISDELDEMNEVLEEYLQNQLLTRTPFYIEAVAANSAVKIGPNKTVSSNNLTLKYSTDNSTWNDYTLDDVIQLPNVGDRVYFKGNNTTTDIDKTADAYNAVQCSGTVNAGGNIISLLDKSMLSKTLYEDYTFYKLFALAGNTLVDASKLQLPATRLAHVCYSDMFNGCTSLSAAPELPATKLSNKCYANMFSGCTSLTTAPELPATILGDRCYGSMFDGCTSLSAAPELPATTVKDYSYSGMFSGCTALTTAPELPATNVAYNCYSTMFKNCSALTTPPAALSAATLADNCYTQMFYGCTSLSAAPELPATTLASTCYQAMFYGCTSLSAAPELPATTLVSRCYEDMFRNCSNINEVKVSFTDWNSAETSTANWLRDTANTGTFYCPNGLDTTTRGNNTLPVDWTVVNI